MSSGIILYQSKYGATKKYAEWLKAETGFDCVETKKANILDVGAHDCVILGGGIYASGIAGLSYIKKFYDVLKNKKLAVFCVGASPYEETTFSQIVARNFMKPIDGVPCFYCRGAWDENIMSFRDRTLCKLLKKSVAKKPIESCEPWEKALKEAFGQKCDWTDREYLQPILAYIRE